MPSQVLAQAVLGRGNVDTENEATGHTNLFSIYFTSVQSTISDRQPRKTGRTLVTLSLPQSANAAECCQSAACFPKLPSALML